MSRAGWRAGRSGQPLRLRPSQPGPLSATLPPTATLPALVRGTTVFERNDQCSGPADSSLNYGSPGDRLLMCDWDGNGTKTPGVFRNGFWLLRNAPAGDQPRGWR